LNEQRLNRSFKLSLISILCSISIALTCPGQRIVFTNLTSDDGLDYEGVQAVAQDKLGFVWLANGSDLKRYDGHEIISALDSSQFGNISAMSSDKAGRLWMGIESHGLSYFDPITTNHIPLTIPAIAGQSIQTLIEDSNGNILIGTNRGIFRYSHEANEIAQLSPDNFPGVNVLVQDELNDIWAATKDGKLYRATKGQPFAPVWNIDAPILDILIDKESIWITTKGRGLFDLNKNLTTAKNYLPSLDVYTAYKDSHNGLWFGTNNGLCRFFPATGKFYHYYGDQDDSRSLSSNQVNCIFEDRTGVLWIGNRSGISRFPLQQHFFERLKHRAGEPSTLSHDSVQAIFQDIKGRLWAATEDGINVSNSAFGGFQKLDIQPNSSLLERPVSVISQGQDETVWLGTRGAGLILCDPVSGQNLEFRHDNNNPLSLPNDTITDILTDTHGTLWLGTDGAGLIRMVGTTGTFATVTLPGEKAHPAVRDLLLDQSGRIWVASADNTIRSFLPSADGCSLLDPSMPVAIPAGITVLKDGTDGNIWIGTQGKGLFSLSPASGELKSYNRHNSLLPDNHVMAVETDHSGKLWISTGNGLAQFDPAKESFRAYNASDGLQSMVFHPRASTIDKTGRLYFSGPRGLNIIDITKLPTLPLLRSPVLTSFELNGERIDPSSENPILQQSLALTGLIDLPYDENGRFSISFATLDFASSRHHFRYKLSNVDTDWINLNKTNTASYQNLNPGEYTFEVQSSLDGQHWDKDSAHVILNITPPWHKTDWAKLSLLCFGISALSLLVRFSFTKKVRKAQRQREELELQRNKAETELANEVSRSMLLQRASVGSDGRNPFTDIMANLQAHFKSGCCSLHAYSSFPTPTLNLLALHTTETPCFDLQKMSTKNPLIRRVLSSARAIVSTNVAKDYGLAQMGTALADLGIKSLLAVNTTYKGVPNGIIMMLHFEADVDWPAEDVRMIEVIGAQLGTAIANQRLIIEDAHQKEQLAIAREAADVANRAKSDFLTKMTHELRTPLNAILGFSQLLEGDETLNDTQRETLGIINGSGEHLLEVINDVLDMAKIEAGSIERHDETFDLFDLLNSVERMLAMKAKSLCLDLKFLRGPGTPQTIIADKAKLRQVLVNLIGNSLKFTVKGGITVRIFSRLDTVDKTKSQLHFDIEDTGAGVAEEELHKLFEKFGQTSSGRKAREGTGLGLPITKSFVELMGGTISAQSTVDVGTTFSFHIVCQPVATKPQAVETRPAKPSGAKITGLSPETGEIRILIAEDQPVNRLLLSTLLKKAGFTVGEAENGKLAIEKWAEWRPHLIFMDQEMPVMNGNEATIEIIAQSANDANKTAIISLTAHALEDSRRAAMDAGCVDFLPKPFKHEELYAILEKHLPLTYQYA
jgi:signal transduction histidine kinase/ligand-binding sensor domain-containing protein/CheY-like chemotaxis protein